MSLQQTPRTYSRHATGVTLLLYDGKNFVNPLAALTLHPLQNKTEWIWHRFVPRSAAPGAQYHTCQVEGPGGARHRFDSQKVLLDPFAKHVFFPPGFVMGRHAGWLALQAGIAGRADAILIPEIPDDIVNVAEPIQIPLGWLVLTTRREPPLRQH